MSTAIPLTYVLPVLHELERLGHRREALFRKAGLQVRRGITALPALEFTRLYGCAIRLLESETSRRADHGVMSKEIMDLLCHCVISCPRLVDVIDRAASFNRILGPFGGSLERVQRADGTVDLIIDSHRLRRDAAAFLVDLASMNFYRQLFSWLIGRPIRLLRASVMYPPTAKLRPIAELLGVPLTYGAADNRLVLSATDLEQPVVRCGPELTRSLDFFPFPFDVWIGDVAQDRPSDRLRMLLMDALQHRGGLTDGRGAARLLGTSPATLRRRLREAGTSYAKMRAACQREWAEYLLVFTRSPVNEIANQLGFSDDRAFRRAFRKWTGSSPVEFRRGRGPEADSFG